MTLQEKYHQKIVPAMMKKFNYKNALAVPKLEKAVLNVGVGQALKDEKYIEAVENNLKRISGQKPIKTRAKKAVSGFKIRQGQIVGMKITLRRRRMYDFIDKLINIALPRVRDFRGISPKSLDGKGNLTIGFKEHLVFPEINPDEVEKIHGIEVIICTTAKNNQKALELFKLMGIPFK